MRIPSIIKIPKHQRFHIEPRYYDPIKEEIEQRTSRIKKEIKSEKESIEEDEVRHRLAGTFSGRIAKRERNVSTGVLQFVLVIVLFLGFFGYIYFGNIVLYLLGLFTLLFVYMKFRKIL